MARFLITQVLSVSLLISAVANGAQVTGNDAWSKTEMYPRAASRDIPVIPKVENVRLLPQDSRFPADIRCDLDTPCSFALHYFQGENFDLDNGDRKNILFIAGGPGQISETDHSRMLENIEKKHNVVYFHLRGSGLSLIKGSNDYDQFLRARYVVEDIERLRIKVLGTKPWDAIYGHSWGTIVAQLYAATYGKSSNPSERKVNRLILSAPIVRRGIETQQARVAMTLKNLRKIYEYYSGTPGECGCPNAEMINESTSFLAKKITAFDDHLGGLELEETDHFCFMSTDVINKVVDKVKDTLIKLEPSYGSIDFVQDHFKVMKRDKSFKTVFPYPLEVAVALRKLEFLGAPEGKSGEDGLVFLGESKERINAALVIAYYLAPRNPPNLLNQCELNTRFLQNSNDTGCKLGYCTRLKEVVKVQPNNENESKRAHEVFGVYDGIARWVFRMLPTKTIRDRQCFTGRDLKNFANGPRDKKRFVRDEAKRIGMTDPDELICGWDPQFHPHEVPTLILKGSADAVTAGCQAEDFFRDGLPKNQRLLLELPGLGHGMNIPTLFGGGETDYGIAFRGILEGFIKFSARQFENDIPTQKFLKILGASVSSDELMPSCAR